MLMANATSGGLLKATQRLFKILQLDKKDISSIYFFAILGGLISLSLPLGIQTIINFVMAGSISSSIVVLIIIVVFGVFINGFVQVRQMQIIEKIKQKIFTRKISRRWTRSESAWRAVRGADFTPR